MSELPEDPERHAPEDVAGDSPTPPPISDPDADESVDRVIDAAVIEALDRADGDTVGTIFSELHYADAADLLERIDPDRRAVLVQMLGDALDPVVLAELDESVREEVLEDMNVEQIAAAVQELESDDALEVFGELEAAEQQQVLDAIPAADRALIEESLSYPEDSAGRLMQRETVSIPAHWSVGETIDFMRKHADEDDETMPMMFYDIFVVDPFHRPIGALHLSHLLRSKRPVKVADIMQTELKPVPVTMDQEDVAFLFRQRDLVSAPVVDEAGRLVGAITIDDVVDVIHEEHEEDMLRMAGVGEDDLYEAAIDTTKARFRWLLVNLGTAVLASIVIDQFEATLDQIVALAVLMPIVASMGGNAGTQTLTVAVRALATRELTPTNAARVIFKELMVGGINGLMFAVIAGGVAWYWFGDPVLGIVIGLAMVVNLVVAGLAGATIPLMLDRVGVDPAVASSVVLTTITDVVGFFAFLGLAALILF